MKNNPNTNTKKCRICEALDNRPAIGCVEDVFIYLKEDQSRKHEVNYEN